MSKRADMGMLFLSVWLGLRCVGCYEQSNFCVLVFFNSLPYTKATQEQIDKQTQKVVEDNLTYCDTKQDCAKLLSEGMTEKEIIEKLGDNYTPSLLTCGQETPRPFHCKILVYSYYFDGHLGIIMSKRNSVWVVVGFL